MIGQPWKDPKPDMPSFVGRKIHERYLLQEYISEGNFGAVYRSEQHFLGISARRVAVKLSKKTGIDGSMARDIFADVLLLAQAMDEMTDAEARSHLVQVYDAGICPRLDNRLFVVMEYVQGTTLAAQFESYRLVPASVLLRWSRQICRAIEGLHMLTPPVLHRDLKPDNVLFGVDLTVRVVDFGLAGRLLHCGYLPGTAGSLAFMAPETTRGESVPESDVYGIGITMYKGLTGRHPFSDLIPPYNLPSSLYSEWLYTQKSKFEPLPPSALYTTIPAELSNVVLRCLKFKPYERFMNAGDLLKALDDLEKGKAEPPDVIALGDAKQLQAEGDLDRARRTFEDGLDARPSSRETRFGLLVGLGGILERMGDQHSAAMRLVEAWELTRKSAILRTRKERADLLGRIADAYSRSGNPYQARRYESLKEKEVSGLGR